MKLTATIGLRITAGTAKGTEFVMFAAKRLRRWPGFALYLMLVLFPVMSAHALDQVSLQLRWKHQFQFAGYYAAIEKGFYRENGLEVEIREGGADLNAGAAVAEGRADFGVCTTSILLNSATRANNVVLAAIFQHSAAVLLTPYRAGIHSRN